MKPVWHPLSAVLTVRPPTLASARLVRTLLAADGEVRLRYAGDALWPALRHGEELVGEPLDAAPLRPGDVVLAGLGASGGGASGGGAVDVVRVAAVHDARVVVAQDAGEPRTLAREELLARVRRPRRRVGRVRRALHRLALDLHEACTGRPDADDDPAASVRLKYDRQAPVYARSAEAPVEASLMERIRETVPEGRRILVLGSGTGLECFGLAVAGWRVTGVDFAPAMVARARQEARRRELDVELVEADLRRFDAGAGTFGAVLFTYDVYSFLPDAAERVALLRRARAWLEPGGVVLLSARRVSSRYACAVHTLQWIAGRAGRRAWGASHTRWLAHDGSLHRSFVQVFTERRLRAEVASAGFAAGPWLLAHCVLRPDGSA